MKKLCSLSLALLLGISAVLVFASEDENTSEESVMTVSQEIETPQNLRKIKRMKFVQMIVDSKKECRNMHKEDKAALRDCFRGKIKDGIIERTKRIRDTAASCREEKAENVKQCALQKYLNIREEKKDSVHESSEEMTEEMTSEESSETETSEESR